MFIELTDAIRLCGISINVNFINRFYEAELLDFEVIPYEEIPIDDPEFEINTIIETPEGRLYVQETYAEIKTSLKVIGMYR